MQVVAAVEGFFLFVFLDHVEAEGVLLVRPLVELFFPGGFFAGDGLGALGLGGVTGQGFAGQAFGEFQRGGFGIAADTDGNFLHQTKVGVVGFHLDDLGGFGPVVHAVLWERAEGTHARTEGDHHVGLSDQLHGGLGTLVAQGAGPQFVAGRESIVAQVAGHHRGAQALGQSPALFHGIAHHHTATRQDHRELG